ncbi:hypothetical protein H2198_003377 [Neophaeococcomyces mojaviensis]|uniref:Uncharacterized protein n=1 Tax=Neophaeococcomyces mojaviensis TaxID=3383035 RepID=A0ACC3ABE0_9EURO|nr:hypothetical protein H2198_003377 [Knufia sp. JES_112]
MASNSSQKSSVSPSSFADVLETNSPPTQTKKYATIRPRPEPAITISDTKQALLRKQLLRQRNPYSGCFISRCRTRNCRLSTHQQWVSSRSPDKQTDITNEAQAAIGTTSGTVTPDSRLDALPGLPAAGLEGPEIKKLFHMFFSYDYPRLTALLHPPAITDSAKKWVDACQQEALDRSLTSSVYCYMYIASAHLHELTRRNDLSPNKVSGVLRGKLLQLMREKLDNFVQVEVENIIMVILTIVQFDLALTQHVVLDSHRSALQHLVTKQGGLHNIRYAVVYVITLDRILAMYTAKTPLYAETIDRTFLRPPKIALQYGSNLDGQNQQINIDSDVAHFCYDVCRAIEIVEDEKWTFEPGRTENSYDASQIHYLYFLKYHIHNTFAHLQSRTLAVSEKSRPILFASNIVAYFILQLNYMPAITRFLSNRLRGYLEEQNLPRDWLGYEDILSWIMCALLSTPGHWDGRDWAKLRFIELKKLRYGNSRWPRSWISNEIKNVRKYVWSARLDKYLTATLTQLESSRDSRSET